VFSDRRFDLLDKVLELGMLGNSGVVDCRGGGEERDFLSSICVSDCSFLISVQLQKFTFFLSGKALICIHTILNFFRQDGHQRIVFVPH